MFTGKGGRSCSRSTYVTLMPPMLNILDESGMALGSLRSATAFVSMAVQQVGWRANFRFFHCSYISNYIGNKCSK